MVFLFHSYIGLTVCKTKVFPRLYRKVRYSGCAPMYYNINVIFITMDTENPQMM